MSQSPDRRSFILSIAATSLGQTRAMAQQEPSPGGASSSGGELRSWVKFYSEVAAGHDFRTRDHPDESLKLEAEPLLVYSHPSGLKGTHGAFYTWTHAGRPEVVGSIWSYEAKGERRTIVHEFDSLATSPLVDVRIAGGTWSQKRVIEPQAVPDAPPLKATVTPRARLTQMKQLANRFEGYSTTNEVEVKLRMLPRPLYQSQSVEGAVRDFALFCFFADWDPEIVLLIESRETPAGTRWHYSAARFNVCPMWLDYEKNRVWKVGKEPNTDVTFGDPNGPFFAVHEVAAQPANLEKSVAPARKN